MLTADAVKAYKRNRQPGQAQNGVQAVGNNDRTTDLVVKSVVRIRWNL